MSLEYEYIADSEAPRPPKKQSAVASEVLAMLQELPRNKVIRLKIPEGQSEKGARISVGRIASNSGHKVESWSVPTEEGYIYIKKVQ